MLDTLPGDDLRSVRDRAVLALGMAGAFRRSELVALTLADLGRVPEGLGVTIRKSKTDPEGEGAVIAIPEGTRLHPAARLDAWIARAGLSDGFLFRHLFVTDAVTPSPMSDRAVARLVQACAKAAGFGPAAFAGHSLRNRRAACMPRFAIGGEIIPYHPGSTAGQRSGARRKWRMAVAAALIALAAGAALLHAPDRQFVHPVFYLPVLR